METELDIESMALGGDGVGRVEGKVCFVPFGLPGDRLRVRVVEKAKRYVRAEIEEVVTPSPHRCEPVCPEHGRSGECDWAHFGYPGQAEWKRRLVAETLARIGGIETEVGWAEDAALRLGYRTRAELHGDGTKLGFYERGSRKIVDLSDSPLCHARLNAAIAELAAIGVKGNVTITVNPEGEETLVWTKFPQRRLKHRFPLANSAIDDRTRRTRFVFDAAPVVNGCFAQASLLLNRLLSAELQHCVGKAVSVLDLYSGNGNLSIGLPERVRVVGMDHDKEAVKAARQESGRDYRAGDERKMRGLIAEDEWDTVLLDPPRTGAKAIVPVLAQSHARAIVYVSCDPATLARDLRGLTDAGWRLVRATAIDLFPYTPHIETVCRLEPGGG